MKQGVLEKRGSRKGRIPHERLTPAGDFARIWNLAAREEMRPAPEKFVYRPLDRESLREVSCALGYRLRDKEDVHAGVISIHSPQLHKREVRRGISSSGHNCYWFIEESLPKRQDAIGRLEEAANKGDEPAFLKYLEKVKWQDQTAAGVVRSIKLAFRVGAFKAACHIASEGMKFHADNVDIQKYARILSPVIREAETHRAVNTDTRSNRQWLKEHAGQYRGKWIALRNGELIGASPSLDTLIEEVSKKYGITFPSREVMITSGY
jgi:hypothetical protein